MDFQQFHMEIKHDVDPADFTRLHPTVFEMIGWTMRFCEEHQLPFVITSLISDREGVKTVSRTHQTGRAFDVRTIHWSIPMQVLFCKKINEAFQGKAAISMGDGQARAAVQKPTHIHVQARP